MKLTMRAHANAHAKNYANVDSNGNVKQKYFNAKWSCEPAVLLELLQITSFTRICKQYSQKDKRNEYISFTNYLGVGRFTQGVKRQIYRGNGSIFRSTHAL